MKTHRIGIIMNGVTGRMGTNQHLIRSIDAIIKQGGIRIAPDEVIMPDPILVGRSESKLHELCQRTSATKWSTNLDEVLADPQYSGFFDAQTTGRRQACLLRETHRLGTARVVPASRREARRGTGQAITRRRRRGKRCPKLQAGRDFLLWSFQKPDILPRGLIEV